MPKLRKECSVCGIFKPPTQFYKQKNGTHGVRGDCKECFVVKGNKYKMENPKKYCLYSIRSQFKAKNRKHQQRVTNIVYNARQSGWLIKPKNCQCCNSIRPLQGHHFDYDRPKDVIWLCLKCHGFLHKYMNFLCQLQDKEE